jgi:high-affinity Fe2+/Pb2+ permease
MERRKPNLAIGIGAAIGAVLAAVLYCYLLALEPGGFQVSAGSLVGLIMIADGMILGVILGWIFSRSRPTAEQVISVPQGRKIRILLWLTTAMAILLLSERGGKQNS